MNRSLVIDCLPDSAINYRDKYAIVVIDVMRATTTAITAVSLGWSVFPVKTTDEAFVLAESLNDPLLVGELGGHMPYGFDMTNSPAQVASRIDVQRPMILLSSSGTQLLLDAKGKEPVYVACFRNISAVAKYVMDRHPRVAILGAGSRGAFRREDQMCCAFIADQLLSTGYEAENQKTMEIITRWRGADLQLAASGRSGKYLRDSGQQSDIDFILAHYDDLQVVPILVGEELVSASST